MIELTIGTTLERHKVLVSIDTTIKQALTDAQIDFTVGRIHLDGVSLDPEDFESTFRELGITSDARLIQVSKGDAA